LTNKNHIPLNDILAMTKSQGHTDDYIEKMVFKGGFLRMKQLSCKVVPFDGDGVWDRPGQVERGE
jgi:hypothetical protein